MRAALFAALCSAAALFAGGAIAEPAQPAQKETASTEVETAPQYAVLRHDVSIPFALRAVTGFSAGEDRSLIMEAQGHRFYRAELDPFCARELKWRFQIAVVPGPSGTLYRGDHVRIGRYRCLLLSLDEIADPRPHVEPQPDVEKAG